MKLCETSHPHFLLAFIGRVGQILRLAPLHTHAPSAPRLGTRAEGRPAQARACSIRPVVVTPTRLTSATAAVSRGLEDQRERNSTT